jgi:hypothetical protein
MSDNAERVARELKKRLGGCLNGMVADLDIIGQGQYLRELIDKFVAESRPLIHTAIIEARLEEREACAKRVEAEHPGSDWFDGVMLVEKLAKAIRERQEGERNGNAK